MTENQFIAITKIVIDKLEGGYYHPNMLKDGRVKDPKGLFSAGPGRVASGETMFGIDRVNGGSINTTPAGTAFWRKIDASGAANTWAYNYRGGSLMEELKILAAKVMYPEYLNDSKKYLSTEAQSIVNSDNRLIFHFSYASWNGPGWFKRFAKPINEAVAKGTKNPNDLLEIALKSRIQSGNPLIETTGNKIAEFINDLNTASISAGLALKKKWPLILGMSLLIGGGTWMLIEYLNKTNK